jgi:putative N6-adenine-specific DNA methylase
MAGRVILKKKPSTAAVLGDTLLATCPGGSEAELAREMSAEGFRDVVTETGAVRVTRTPGAGIREANSRLRTASRILIPLLRFPAADYDEVYRKVKSLPWGGLLPIDRTFSISATSRSEPLRDHRFLAMRTKDAMVDRQREENGGKRSSVDRDDPDLGIVVFAGGEDVEISLDSSGTPLHERGYRTESGDAPLRETVAAMIILTARRREHEVILDPFCGSGTLAIEAAMIIAGKPPGALGRHYAWERWDWLQTALNEHGDAHPDAASDPREHATPRERNGSRSGPAAPKIIAADSDPEMIAIAQRNAARAGVADMIEFHVSDVRDSLDAVARRRSGLLVTNPPYGRRLNPPELDQLYREFGLVMKRSIGGWDAWIILGEGAPYQSLGLAPDRKVQVFNGGMAAQLCHYQLRTHDPRRPGGRPR